MKKIVVVGGGIAGLAAGIYARLSGYEVEIYEKNSVAGGQCMGWKRDGFLIDNCIHWLTGTRSDTSLYKVWKTTGALNDETEYADVKEFFTCCIDGKKATLWNDLERTEKELIELSPQDESEIKKFIEHVRYAQDCLFPAEKPMEMMSIKDYINMGKSMQNMPKVIKEFGSISLEEFSKRFKNPVIRAVMSDYMPSSYTAYSFLVSYATMASGNGKIPLGGSLEMALRMKKRFSDLGGKIFTGHGVQKIVIEKSKATGVILEDGSFVNADFVIPAVDATVLFNKLIDKKYIPKKLAEAYSNQNDYPIFSGLQAAFSVSVENASKIQGITLWNCEPFKIGNRTFDKISLKPYDYDDAYKNDGRTVLQINVCQGDDDYKYWASLSKEEYAKAKSDFCDAAKKRIEEEFSFLRGDLTFIDCWTPLTYEKFCNSYRGAYMSFITTPQGKGVKLKGTIKGIKNLYLAGQWVMSPGGLPVAVTSGKFAVMRILKKEKLPLPKDK